MPSVIVLDLECASWCSGIDDLDTQSFKITGRYTPPSTCGGATALPGGGARAHDRDHRRRDRTGRAMDGVGKRCGRCARHERGERSTAATQWCVSRMSERGDRPRLAAVQPHFRAAEHAPTTETTAGGTARDVLWMVWASGAVGMPATSAGNDPPPPLSGVSRMIEPMTAFEL